jgi:hypothetical protein
MYFYLFLFLFCILAPCTPENGFQHCRTTHSLHLQGVNDGNVQQEGHTGYSGHGICDLVKVHVDGFSPVDLIEVLKKSPQLVIFK